MSTLTEPAGDRPQVLAETAPRHAVRSPRSALLLLAALCVLAVVVAIVFAHDGPAQTSKGSRTSDAAPVVRLADQR